MDGVYVCFECVFIVGFILYVPYVLTLISLGITLVCLNVLLILNGLAMWPVLLILLLVFFDC